MLNRPQRNIGVVLNNGETRLTFPNASFSLLDNGKDDEHAVDVIATLKKYYEADFIEQYELEIVNDGTIYEAPLSNVLQGMPFLQHMQKYIEALED